VVAIDSYGRSTNRPELKALEDFIPKNTKIKPKTLLEVGSHNAFDCERLQRAFGLESEDIYVVEAHPKFYSEIKERYPKYNVFNFAANNIAGKVFFNAAKDWDDGRSSVLTRDIYEANNFYQIECESKRLDAFFKENKVESIDIFKLDVEGLSYEVLESCGEYLAKIKCIQVENEYEQLWEGQKTAKNVYDLLMNKGFELIWSRNEVNIQDDSLWVRKEYL
jgi:FkbM family methyltransferase